MLRWPNGPLERLALGDDELELALGRQADRELRDRPLLDLNSTLAPEPGLPWYFSELRTPLAFGDVDVVRPVVADQTNPSLKSIGWNSAKLPPIFSGPR